MRNWWKLTVGSAIASLAALTLLTGCGQQHTAAHGVDAATGKMRVVATFYPMYEFSKQVAGDHADITLLIPGGTEPHDWEPTPKDVAKIAQSKLFVYNGLVEQWVPSVMRSVDDPRVHQVEASKGISLVEGINVAGDEQEEIGLDPHVWLDPVYAQKEVRNIEAAFEQADPAHKADYQKNADAYVEKLQALDKSYQQTLAHANQRDFVTSHTAFTYLAKRYHLVQVPIAGLSPEQEPSASDMADIVAFTKQHHVKTIFFETLVSPKVADTVAKEIGAKTDVLNPLEGLTEEEKQQGLDYLGVMQNNLTALQKALSK